MDTGNMNNTPRFDWEASDLVEEWRTFIQHAEFWFSGPLNNKSEEEKCNYLMIWIGNKGRDIYSTWTLTADEKKSFAHIKGQFEKHVKPKTNRVYSRYRFLSRKQKESETFEKFLTDLKLLAKDCGYPEEDNMIRDVIVFGTKDHKVREKCINEGSDLTLEKAINFARTFELSKEQVKSMEDRTVNVVHKRVQKDSRRRNPNKTTKSHSDNYQCRNCGKTHGYKQCPAFGKQCSACKKMNHFAAMCLSSRNPQGNPAKLNKQTKHVHTVDLSDDEVEELFVGSLYVGSNTLDIQGLREDNKWSETINVENSKINFQLDTGAKCSVLPSRVIQDIDKAITLKPTPVSLRSFSNHTIKSKGSAMLRCSYKGKTKDILFYIIDMDVHPVLGSDDCEHLGLVQRVHAVESESKAVPKGISPSYSDVFNGLGCLPGTYSIKVDPSVRPVIHAPRRIPFSIKDKVKAELDRMEEIGVIVKQTKPTQWVNSMVTATKPNGKIRICIDPRDLNKAIQREHFPLKTVEEVAAMMPGAKVFSKLDATSGFWQMRLDEESSKLCTFNTPFGRYRFTRLPFGVNSAPEVFQRAISDMVQDLDGTEAIIDDILVWGTSQDEHDRRLSAVLERSREHNLKLSVDKCEISKSEVTYVGHRFTDSGLKPDPEKIRAILSMNRPSNVKELQTFIGFVQYLGKFMPKMSEVSSPLRVLLEKDTAWSWQHEQEDSFNKLKEMATRTPVLQYYDPQKPITLSVDASSKGLGAVLVQEDKPVAYASRALTATQQRYSQIEKETLAILYGCEKFHDYVYGRHITVESDHRPLQAIFKKPILNTPPRLQRLLLTMQRYDVEVVYKPGKLLFLADHLSRAYLNETKEVLVPDIQVNDIHLTSYLPVSPDKYRQLKEATANDDELQQLQDVILEGWPENKVDVPLEMRPYYTFRDELSCIDGLMYKSHKLIVPKAMKNEMLDLIHSSHLGVVKCKNRARDILFWLGMSRDIEERVSSCEICAKHQNANPKEPMIATELPSRPWSRIGMDLFEFKGSNYLLTVDYFSKWPEIQKLESLTTKSVVVHVKSMIAKYGIPDEVVSDNGPQFGSSEFRDFVKEYGFVHTTSSPYYAQSNGQAERTVQTVKRLLLKAKDPYLGLLEYRNSKIDGLEMSPAQMFLGRRLKTQLPTTAPLLASNVNSASTLASMKLRQAKQQENYNKHARQTPLKRLDPGDRVMINHPAKGTWEPGTVVRHHYTPRSYVVDSSVNGKRYRRNRQYLKPTRSNVTKERSTDVMSDMPSCDSYVKPKVDDLPNTVSKEPHDNPKDVVSTKTPTPQPAQSTPPESLERSPVKVTRSGRVVNIPERYRV